METNDAAIASRMYEYDLESTVSEMVTILSKPSEVAIGATDR